MMSERFEVAIVDHHWPDLKIIVMSPTFGTIEERVLYDGAYVKFEVTLQNMLRKCVQKLINSHKRS